MISIKRQSRSNGTDYLREKSTMQILFEKSLKVFNYDLSENTCLFIIGTNTLCYKYILNQKLDCLLILNFDRKYFSPKIYNDRRIFHPNICVETCQVYFSQLKNYNPAFTLEFILRKLKYTILEPMMDSIPNNELNKKAAMVYMLSRNSFYDSLMKYAPLVLDQLMKRPINTNEIEEQKVIQATIDMSMIVPNNRSEKNLQKQQNLEYQENTQITILVKKLKHINFTEMEKQ